MKKKILRLLLSFSVVLTLMLAMAMTAMAADKEDGIKAEQTVNTSSGNIEVTLKVTAEDGYSIEGVTLKNQKPDGYKLLSGKAEVSEETIQSGKSMSLTSVYTKDTGAVKTGDSNSNSILLFGGIAILSAVLVILLITRGKKWNKKIFSLFLCCILVASSAFTFAGKSYAYESESNQIEFSKEVTIGSEKVTVNSVVSYDRVVANIYKVTFDSKTNGGSLENQVVDETYDSKYILPAKSPIKIGHDFTGWFTAVAGGTQVTTDSNVKITADSILYAQFDPIEYSWTFDANGGMWQDETTTKIVDEKYGTKYILPESNPTRTDHIFDGWWTAKEGGKQITTDTDFKADSRAAYAHWIEDNRTFKAVYDTTDDANTLTFYYDNKTYSGDDITVYDNLPTAATKNTDWGYNSIRSNVKSVAIDESVKNYTDLTSTAYMFMTMTNAESITGAEYLNVSNVTNMSCMFYNYGTNAISLATVPNVSNWNTANVTNMSYMFYNYGSKSTSFAVVPDVREWNTGNVTDMNRMFQGYGSASEVLNVVPAVNGDNWNTDKVEDMSYMFNDYGKSSKQLNTAPDVSRWNTGNVTNISYMFKDYGFASEVLNAAPVVSGNNWNTSKVTKMNYMFAGYGKNSYVLDKVPDVSNWNTEKVTNMAEMFFSYGYSSTALTKVPDVSKWKTGSVTDVNCMFQYYGKSSELLEFKLNLSEWSVASVTDFNNMFDEAGAALPQDSDKWNVTIPAKTGDRANDVTHWYVGDGTNEKKYIEPAKITSTTTYRSFTVAPPAPTT